MNLNNALQGVFQFEGGPAVGGEVRGDAVLRRDVYFYVGDAVVLQDFANKGVHAFISVCVFVGDKRGFGCPEGTAFGFYAVGGDLIVENGIIAAGISPSGRHTTSADMSAVLACEE